MGRGTCSLTRSFSRSSDRASSPHAGTLGYRSGGRVDTVYLEPEPAPGFSNTWYAWTVNAPGPVRLECPPVIGYELPVCGSLGYVYELGLCDPVLLEL